MATFKSEYGLGDSVWCQMNGGEFVSTVIGVSFYAQGEAILTTYTLENDEFPWPDTILTVPEKALRAYTDYAKDIIKAMGDAAIRKDADPVALQEDHHPSPSSKSSLADLHMRDQHARNKVYEAHVGKWIEKQVTETPENVSKESVNNNSDTMGASALHTTPESSRDSDSRGSLPDRTKKAVSEASANHTLNLLPCPFCGSPAEGILNINGEQITTCGDESDKCQVGHRNFTVEEWNARAPVSQREILGNEEEILKKMRDEHTFLRAALMDMVFHGGRVSQKGFKQKAYYDAFCEAYSNAKELLTHR